MRTNAKYPVLPASRESLRWGLKGADDGLAEYRAAHNGKTGTLGDAMRENQEFINGQYKPAYLSAKSASY